MHFGKKECERKGSDIVKNKVWVCVCVLDFVCEQHRQIIFFTCRDYKAGSMLESDLSTGYKEIWLYGSWHIPPV